MTQKPVRLGVIGAGGRMRGTINRLVHEVPGNQIRVTAVYDPEGHAHKAVRADVGYEFESVVSEQALAQHPEVDWVFIGSWNAFHARQAIAALEAGKHVFCEKPLATTFEDCLAIRDAVKKSGRIFAFGLVQRYSPHHQKIRELVASGAIGQLISFEFNETLGFDHGGYIFGNWRRKMANAGSLVLEKCCHDLDVANWIVDSLPTHAASFAGRDFFVPKNEHYARSIGPDINGREAYQPWPDLQRVDSFSEGSDIADNQVSILQYANGVRATFHINCHVAMLERRLYLCGSEGTIRADVNTGSIEVQRIGRDLKVERVDTGYATLGPQGGGHDEAMVKRLVETLVEGRKPLATVEEGIRSCAVAFAIDEAVRDNKVVALKPWWDAAGIDPASHALAS